MGAVDESAVYKSIMASVTKIQAESVHGTVNLASVNATVSTVELVAAPALRQCQTTRQLMLLGDGGCAHFPEESQC